MSSIENDDIWFKRSLALNLIAAAEGLQNMVGGLLSSPPAMKSLDTGMLETLTSVIAQARAIIDDPSPQPVALTDPLIMVYRVDDNTSVQVCPDADADTAAKLAEVIARIILVGAATLQIDKSQLWDALELERLHPSTVHWLTPH